MKQFSSSFKSSQWGHFQLRHRNQLFLNLPSRQGQHRRWSIWISGLIGTLGIWIQHLAWSCQQESCWFSFFVWKWMSLESITRKQRWASKIEWLLEKMILVQALPQVHHTRRFQDRTWQALKMLLYSTNYLGFMLCCQRTMASQKRRSDRRSLEDKCH